MPGGRNPNDPQWDWLFRDGLDQAADGSAADREDFTGMLPIQPGEPRENPTASGGPAVGRTSFGGTYARPQATGRQLSTGQPPRQPPAQLPTAQPAAGPEPTRQLQAGPAPPDARASSSPPPSGPPSSRPVPSGLARRGRVHWLRWVLAALVGWLLFLVLVPVYAWSQVSKVPAEPAGNRPAGGPGTTYLLVGSDSREGLTPGQKKNLGTGSASGQRTDTIILLHVSDSGPNVMLSIPRDSYVEVPGHGMQKINAAYAYGGPKLLVRTVEKATGVRVDDYVEIGFTGVVDVVDAVGGITVCPKTSIHDPKAGHLVMQRGCQQVNGHIALDYSRSRAFPLGDITRTQHQREVIAATGEAAASWRTVVLPWRYWRVNLAGANSVTVGDNVSAFAFARFAWAMAHSSGPGTLRCVVPFTSLGTSTSVGSVVTWDKGKAAAIFADINDDETSAIHCKAT